jgi:hypothetical protein
VSCLCPVVVHTYSSIEVSFVARPERGGARKKFGVSSSANDDVEKMLRPPAESECFSFGDS